MITLFTTNCYALLGMPSWDSIVASATPSPLVQVGDYLIVEDGICHHGLEVGPNSDPMEAIETFIAENSHFEIDRQREAFVITWNPKGYLRRVA